MPGYTKAALVHTTHAHQRLSQPFSRDRQLPALPGDSAQYMLHTPAHEEDIAQLLDLLLTRRHALPLVQPALPRNVAHHHPYCPEAPLGQVGGWRSLLFSQAAYA